MLGSHQCWSPCDGENISRGKDLLSSFLKSLDYNKKNTSGI